MVQGNTDGDTQVLVNIGRQRTTGTPTTIRFNVNIRNHVPAGLTQVANQGLVYGANFASQVTNDPDTATPLDPTATVVYSAPSVQAAKTGELWDDVDGDGEVNPGDTLLYSVLVSNTGDQDTSGVLFLDDPDTNTTLVAGSVLTTQGDVLLGNGAGDSSVAVNLGTLAGKGGLALVQFEAAINSPLPPEVTSVSNQGMVSGANFASVPSDDPDTPAPDDPTVTPVVLPPPIEVTKTAELFDDFDGDGEVDPGDVLLYTIAVANNGDRDTSPAAFLDTPGANTTLVAGSVSTTLGDVLTGNDEGDTDVAVDLGPLPAGGEEAVITFEAAIDIPLPLEVTTVSNQGAVSGYFGDIPTDDPDTEAPNDPTVTPVLGAPFITAEKTAELSDDVDGDGEAGPGDLLTYTVVIFNDGDRATSGALFLDVPDPNTTLAVGSVDASQGVVLAGNNDADTSVVVSLGPLEEEWGLAVVTFDAAINSPLLPGVTEVSNQGTVAGINFADALTDDPDTPEPSDPTITPVVSTEAAIFVDPLSLEFDDQDIDDGPADPQDVTISNEGEATLTIDGVAVAGGAGSPFHVVFDTGEPSLEPGESRTVSVDFDPSVVGPALDALAILSDDPDDPEVDVQLSGAGTQDRGAPIIQNVEDTGSETTPTLGVQWTNPNEVPEAILALAFDSYAGDFVVFDQMDKPFLAIPPLDTSATLPLPFSGGYHVWVSNLYPDLEWFPSDPWSQMVFTGLPHPVRDVSVEDLGGGQVRLHWRPDVFGTWLYEIIPFQAGVGFITVPGPCSDLFPEFAPWTFIDYGAGAYDLSKASFFAGWADFTLPGSGEYWLCICAVGWLPPYNTSDFVLGHIIIP